MEYNFPDPITVGYDSTVYTTDEGQSQVELCAIIFVPDDGGAPRPSSILASTTDDTAGQLENGKV